MADNFRSIRMKNAVLLAGPEATPGVEVALAAADNAIKVENVTIGFEANQIQTNEYTSSLDNDAPIVGGMRIPLSFDVLLKGSGVVGVAPEWGVLMPACAWAEIITPAAIPAAPEALAAGTTTAATLGAGAAATAQAYRGLPLDLGARGLSVVSNYGADKVATLADSFSTPLSASDNYQILPSVLYRPASIDPSSLSFRFYQDGHVYRLAGARGTFSLAAEAGGIGRLSFQMSAMFIAEDEEAVPAAAFDPGQAPVWKGGVMTIDRKVAALQNLTLDSGNTLANPPNPNALEGFDPAEVTARNITGTMNPKKLLKGTRDTLGAFRTGARSMLYARWGNLPGNRISLVIPSAQYTSYGHGDREGLVSNDLGFKAVGADSGAFLAVSF